MRKVLSVLLVLLVGILFVAGPAMAATVTASPTPSPSPAPAGIFAPITNYVNAIIKFVSSDAGYNNQASYTDSGVTTVMGSNHAAPTLVPGQIFTIGRMDPGEQLGVSDTVTVPTQVVDVAEHTVIDGYEYYYTDDHKTYYVESTKKKDGKTYADDVTTKESCAKLFTAETTIYFDHGQKTTEKVISHVVPATYKTIMVPYVWNTNQIQNGEVHALVTKTGLTYNVGFEDQPGMGDRDFNDMVLQVVMTNVTGDLHAVADSMGSTNLPYSLGNLTLKVTDPTGKVTTYPLVATEFSAKVDVDLGEVYGAYTATITDSFRGKSASASFVYQGLDTTIDFSPLVMAYNTQYFYDHQYVNPCALPVPMVVIGNGGKTPTKVLLYVSLMNSNPYYKDNNVTVEYGRAQAKLYGVPVEEV